MQKLWKFLKNWASEASVTILTILSVAGAAEMIYLLTDRAPRQDLTWLLDYSSRCVVIALAITFTSVSKQAFGHWYTLEDLLERPMLALIQAGKSLAIFFGCLYVLLH